MVGAYRDAREHAYEIGLGVLDLFAGRTDTRRAHVAAFAIGDALHRFNAVTPTPQQAREIAAKVK